ncbi:MAG: hypothetical protein F6J95_026235 [Leptolyngbya sp. SIO1E4]|nr:hypothetical protein [Leptolyngbya sp. SIO1E4]
MAVACSKDAANLTQQVPPEDVEITTDTQTTHSTEKQAENKDLDKATPESDTAGDAQNREADSVEVGDDGEPNEPLTANIERLNLQPDTPYGDVRSLVMAEGWVPYTQAEGATPDTATIAVQEMHALGFEEAQSCAGTGQGFCLFEFIHVNRAAFPETRLVIITTPSSGELYGESKFYSWRIDNYEPSVNSGPKGENSNFSWLEANATYENQDLSEALYADVLEAEQDCVLAEECDNARYLFNDVLLTISAGEFGSTTTAIIPHELLSRTQALTYARMLDTNREIDFSNGSIFDNNEGELTDPVRITESFFEADLPAENAAYNRGSIKVVKLISSPGEDIARIEFEIIVL